MRISEYFKAHRDAFKALCARKLNADEMEALLNDMDEQGIQYDDTLARFWGMVCEGA